MPARVVFAGDNGVKQQIDLMTVNVCAGGAFFHGRPPLKAGACVDLVLWLHLDNIAGLQGRRSQIAITGKVLRTETDGMAVLFDGRYRISPHS
ncbi:MAG: hypothetical protein ACOZF0_01460 [Thermodesulfobacteriota bacterium]